MTEVVSDIEDCHRRISTYFDRLVKAVDEDDDDARSMSSVKRYGQDLRWFQGWLNDRGLDPDEMDKAEAEMLGTDLSGEFHGTTGTNRWRSIMEFYDREVKAGKMEENPLEPWNEDKKQAFGLTKSTEQEKHLDDGERYAVTQEDVRAMEEECTNLRSLIVVRMLWQTGLRRGELASLNLGDVNREDREVKVRKSVAKNDEARVVPFQSNLDGLLHDWLDNGVRAEKNPDCDALLVGARGARLGKDGIKDIVVDRAYDAGINRVLYEDSNGRERHKITPHNLRHGYGTWLVNETECGLYEASELLGHSSPEITESVYVEDDERIGVDAGHEYGPE